MKIGILTIHNSSNYGAVLQTFATQEYLKKSGNQKSSTTKILILIRLWICFGSAQALGIC